MDKLAVGNCKKLSLRRVSAWAGVFLGLVILAVFLFGGAVLDSFGKRAAQEAFAKAHPGSVLRIGRLDYFVGANRLVAESVSLSASNATLKVGRLSLTGVRWIPLLWRKASLANVLAKASLEATNLEAQFPQANYGIRCDRLRASVPGSELIADGAELRTLVGDEEFFAAHPYRTPRFHAVVTECRVSGLVYDELLDGKSYRASLIQFSGTFFETLINCDKPVKPFEKSPLMLHEALATIRQPLQIDSLTITNGRLSYGEQFVAGADPGVLTISEISLSANGIANRGEASAAIVVQAQGNLMEAGTGTVRMSIPINPSDFSLHYSGALSEMDLTRLNPFLDLDQHTRIKTGNAKEVTFEIDVIAGQARGHVRANYNNLEIAVLDKQTDTEKGFDNRVSSFFANAFKIRSSSTPDASGLMREGEVNYLRGTNDEFQQFAWFALRTGVLDVITR